MTQEAVQITETPPLPGLQLVQDLNKALQTLATDFSGTTDPAALAWPYSTWADTGTGTLKRRNDAGSAWVIEGRLLRAHLPMYVQADVPTADIGPIYIIGKGPAEWIGGAYIPLIKGIPSATFAEVDALVADQGPFIVTDMPGSSLYTWVNTAYFTGYRSGRCGEMPDEFVVTPRPWELLMTGGVWNINDPKHKRVIAHFREQGLVCLPGDWIKGQGKIADIGSGDWKAPDVQDMFFRKAGTDADTANPVGVGTHKPDTLKAHSHAQDPQTAIGRSSGVSFSTGSSPWSLGGQTQNTGSAETAPTHTRTAPVIMV